MNRKVGGTLFLLLFFCSLLPVSQASQTDIRFVVIGKTANYRQLPESTHELLNYHFFAEIFLREQGFVSNPVLLGPGGAPEMKFEGNASVLEVHGGRYGNEEELNKAFPDGTYIFSYRLSNGILLNESVRINNGTGGSRIPAPVWIRLFQAGRAVMPGSIDPGLDLHVSWSPFTSGNADSHGIVDDLIFVVTGDCHGNKIDHSGGPFGDSAYLTFASTSYIIKASNLYSAEAFQVFVEHAEMDTSLYRGIPEIATYATTSFLDIHTLGRQEETRKKCPQIMPAMDGGQTDRPKLIQ